MEFFEFLERLPQRYYSLALAQITINFTFAGQCLIEIEFLFYPQVIIIPFKNCIVYGYISRKFYYCLPVMLIVKAIHQHCAYVLFQIKQSVTLISVQNRKNDRFYFPLLQMIPESWCEKHL